MKVIHEVLILAAIFVEHVVLFLCKVCKSLKDRFQTCVCMEFCYECGYVTDCVWMVGEVGKGGDNNFLRGKNSRLETMQVDKVQ